MLNERRQNYENRPYGLAQFALIEALYPPRASVSLADDRRSGGSAGRQRSTTSATFFTRYYHPGERLAGDRGRHRDRPRRFRLAETWFDDIPAGPPVDRSRRRHGGSRRRRIVLEDRVELPRLYLAWPTPALFGAGDATLDLLGDMLANGRTSRLYRAAHPRRAHRGRRGGQPGVARARQRVPDHRDRRARPDAGRSRGVVVDETRRLGRERADGRTSWNEAGAQAEASFIYRLQTLGGFGGKCRSAERLQRLSRHAGLLRRGPAALSRRHRGRSRRRSRRLLDLSAMTALSVVPDGHGERALGGSTPAFAAAQ